MDVRCEKCETEYELDESKLKPGGVTVKCTTCGHMFKVRPQSSPPDDVGTVAPPGRGHTPPPMTRASSVLMDAEDGERTWLIRLEDGEIKTCRELSTLQKWIVSGRVSRSCSISRTGKKWKLLGEIGELASFFAIADEAREARNSSRYAPTREYPALPEPDPSPPSASPSHPRIVPRRSSDASAPLHLDDDGPDPMHRRESRFGEGEGDIGVEEEKTVPASYADALAAEMAASGEILDGGMPGSFARTLPLGGAALTPPTQRPGKGVHDAVEMAAQILPVDDRPGDGAAASAANVGGSSPLPPYGAGMLGAGSPARAAPLPAGLPLAPPPSRARPVSMPSGAPAGPVTAGWAVRGQVGVRDHEPSGPTGGAARGGAMIDRDHGPSGPTGGVARGHSAEAAFVGGKSPNMRGEMDGRFHPSSYDEEPLLPRRSRAGLWVILFSLIVLAGAAGAVYLILFTGQEEEPAPVATAGPADAAAVTTLPTTPTPTTPTPTTPTPAAPELDTLIKEADTALQADSQALTSLSEQLSGAAGSGTPPVSLLVTRSRVEAAVAQQLADQAKLASPADAKKLTTQSRARAKTAHQLADQALAVEAEHPAALLAMADARRLEGERTVEVERWLRRARQNPTASQLGSDPDLVTALLRVRDDRLRDARVLLDKLAKTAPAGDVRARFRLAWIDYLDANSEAARTGADAVVKIQAEHPGARALLAKLDAGGRAPVDTADPMPPEQKDKPDEKVGEKPGDKPGEKGDDGKVAGGAGKPVETGGDSFDVILDRADKLAENGNCNGAMPLYRKVLDLHPASVEALTGLGYCHLDRREFASAHARFRAALGISSRYQPAMWGIAEAYQQQGLKQEALERFEAFVAEHPGNPRAEAARSRIEALRRELGAGSGPSQGSSQGSEDKSEESAPPGEGNAPAPSSPPAPSPAPAPSPEGQKAAGSG